MGAKKGQRSNRAKFTDDEIRRIKFMLKNEYKASKIRRIFNCTSQDIWNINNKEYYSDVELENAELILLDAVWLMRWNKDKTAMTAVLTEDEAMQMCKDIIKTLNESGYSII